MSEKTTEPEGGKSDRKRGSRPLPILWLRWVIRGIALALLRAIYRIRVSGAERVPASGALLVANHLSQVDALLLGAALAPREVRFLMHRPLFAIPIVGGFSRLMGAMPVASEDSPEQKAESLHRAATAAGEGDLVCIFAEGGISRSGALLPFARGLETIARDARVPIVPVGLDRLWGSIFSFSGGRFIWKWPRRIPYPVEIAIGSPLPFDSERWRVRDAVAELVARSREERMRKMRSLAYRFLRSARKHASQVALVDLTERAISFRTLLRHALLARAALRRRPSVTGRIGVRMPPGADAAIAHVAIALCGRTAVPMDAGDAEDAEGDRQKADEVLETLSGLREEATLADRTRALWLSYCPGPLLARLLDPVTDGREPVALFLARGAARDISSERRAVLLSHASLASSTESLAQMFRFGPGETVLGVLPFSSVLGSVATLWIPLLSGGRAVYCPELGDRRAVGTVCAHEKPTVVVATPTLYRAWLESCAPEELKSVRLFICGGEPLDRALAEAWQARFGVELCEGYGCTELAAVVSVNLPGIESHDARQNASKPATVGRAIPGVAVRVVDPNTFAIQPPEEEGLILARGPGRMLGYDGDEERTAAAFRDGWFVTGDRGVLDKDAFLRITAPRAGPVRPGPIVETIARLRVEES